MPSFAAKLCSLLWPGCLFATLLAGCGDAVPSVCARPETEEPRLFSGGEAKNGVYSSAPWDGELLHFPGGAHYRIEHNLGAVPDWWLFYLSFGRYGIKNGDSVALATGNQAELKAIDDTSLTVLNASCVEYWLLVRAGSADPP